MNKIFWFIATFLAVGIFLAVILTRHKEQVTQVESFMTFESSAFLNNDFIPADYTCDGTNKMPELSWGGIPEDTSSIAIVVDDPDALGGDWVHFLIWNIPETVNSINETDIPPSSTMGTTSFGKSSWSGPCPPNGTHHYNFKLYALDSQLSLDSTAVKSDLVSAIEGHVLGETSLTGLYERK